jgi:hypothetical protein
MVIYRENKLIRSGFRIHIHRVAPRKCARVYPSCACIPIAGYPAGYIHKYIGRLLYNYLFGFTGSTNDLPLSSSCRQPSPHNFGDLLLIRKHNIVNRETLHWVLTGPRSRYHEL